MSSTSDTGPQDIQVFRIYIEAPAERVWEAITSSEFTTKYGYGGPVEVDLTPGGEYRNLTTAQMREMGMGEVAISGRVIEVDPPRRLVQTWRPAWHDEESTLTWELTEYAGPLTGVTLTHDCSGAPNTAGDVEGTGSAEQGGGGWPWILAGLKTLLETGRPMAGAGG
jgi:uncharacterized protein YndB with AHSA1/START domain